MKFLLGTKIGMTRIFDADGKNIPVTLVLATPSVVAQIKNEQKDKYNAVQIGFGVKKAKNISKPLRGHLKDLGNSEFLKEFRTLPQDANKFSRGQKLDVSVFQEGDLVKISGISKGKGFQGVVKRHGFHGGPASHGQKHSLREAGSIGSTAMQRVIKGKRMPGRMGSDRVTVKNLQVVKIDKENNLLALKGAVPGKRGTLLEIRS